MFDQLFLNQGATKLVKNIYNNFCSHPNYIDYHIEYFEEAGCAVINTTKQGRPINMFRFYPRPNTGDIGSIAIYGIALEGHYNAIKKSMLAYGLPVVSIELVTNNTLSPFVDITLR